jgi:hypothetical protein
MTEFEICDEYAITINVELDDNCVSCEGCYKTYYHGYCYLASVDYCNSNEDDDSDSDNDYKCDNYIYLYHKCTTNIKKFFVLAEQMHEYLIAKFKLDKNQVRQETKEYVLNGYKLNNA